MRELSDSEKALITRIADKRTFFFREFFSDFFLSNVVINIPLSDTKDVRTILHSATIEFRDIVQELVWSIKLVELLEENSLIYKYQIEIEFTDMIPIGKFEGKTREVARNTFLRDDYLKDQLKRYALVEFVVTEELRMFVKRKFKTVDDFRSNKTFRQTRIGLWIAILTALFGAGYSIYSEVKKDSEIKELQERVDILDGGQKTP